MEVTIRHIEHCACVTEAEHRVTMALERAAVRGAVVRKQLVRSFEEAERLGFIGSPTILIDGVDPFARAEDAPAMACRIYMSPSGPEGSPSIDELEKVMRSRKTRER